MPSRTSRSRHRAKPPEERRAKASSEKRQRGDAPAEFVGEVQPIQLGQDGLRVVSGRGERMINAGVPGEWVALSAAHAQQVRATVREVIKASADRIPALCPVLARCGACALQEMSYPAQLAAKQRALASAFAGALDPSAAPVRVIGLAHPFGYRTKLLMAADRGLQLGLFRRGSGALVPAEHCPAQHPLALGVLAMARAILVAAGTRPSEVHSAAGWLHGIGIRVDPTLGSAELLLCARDAAHIPGGTSTVQKLAQLPRVHGVHLVASPKRSSYPLDGALTTLAGPARAPHRIGELTLMLSPLTFLQTNAEAAALLRAAVAELLPPELERLVDLYAGFGAFALSLAPRYQQAVCVEASPSAMSDLAQHLDGRADRRQITPFEARVEAVIDAVLRGPDDVVLLDPPRQGCHPRVMQTIAERRPCQVVYVSCGFEALARDLAPLLATGYRLTACLGVDMFPHTSQIETVVRLEG